MLPEPAPDLPVHDEVTLLSQLVLSHITQFESFSGNPRSEIRESKLNIKSPEMRLFPKFNSRLHCPATLAFLFDASFEPVRSTRTRVILKLVIFIKSAKFKIYSAFKMSIH